MTATVLDRPPVHATAAADERHDRPWVHTGLLLGREFIVETDQPLPDAVLDRLLAHVNDQWDVRRRHSDLYRLSNYPCVVVSVSPVTLRLVRNVLVTVRLARRAGLEPGRCDARLDLRHSRVGLDPTVAAITARLAPANAADLLVDLCLGRGARSGHVQVGHAVRTLDDPIPAWLRQAADDLSRAMGTAPAQDRTGGLRCAAGFPVPRS